MWLFTTVGFYSVVQKKGERDLTIRSRVRGDLDALRSKYLPSLSATVEWAGSDYRFRAKASRLDFAEALGKIGLDIRYADFKRRVAAKQGKKREQVYHAVWSDLMHLERHVGG